MPWPRRRFVYAAVAAGAALVALGPIADGDIYWHLAAGAEMWRRHALLRTDPFTVSAAGRAWVDVHWLFQLGVALVHRASGFFGLAVAKAVVVAAGAVAGTRAAERGGGPWARDACAVVLLALLFLARHLLPLRPIVATLLFVAVFLAALERHRVQPSPRADRALLALAALQAIWVNCQGLAPIGPALVAAYLAPAVVTAARGSAAARRSATPLALALAACVVASFLTPYGLGAVQLPGRLLARIQPGASNVFSTAVAENIPPFVLERTAPEMVAHLRWVLMAFGAALLIVRPRLCPAHALVLGGFTALALMANRNILLLYWVLAPLGAIAIAPCARERLARWWSGGRLRVTAPRWAGTAALAAVLAVEVGAAGASLAREEPIGAPTPFHFPTASARLLAARGARGPVFAPDHAGGYLMFAVPGLRPYIDTRLVLHSAREYEDYLALFDEPARFDALDQRERFPYVVLTTAYPDRYLGLVAHLAASPTWKLLFTDGSEVLFGRADPLPDGDAVDLGDRRAVEAIAGDLDRRFAGRQPQRAAARLNLGRLLVVVGQPAAAERVLAPLTSRAAAALRARSRLAAGELDAAESLARVLLLGDPEDVRSLTLLAQIAVARQASEDARRYLTRALSANPFDAEARALLARMEGDPTTPDRTHAN
jgi:tetratricopeptide (TPR) repeat protein